MIKSKKQIGWIGVFMIIGVSNFNLNKCKITEGIMRLGGNRTHIKVGKKPNCTPPPLPTSYLPSKNVISKKNK